MKNIKYSFTFCLLMLFTFGCDKTKDETEVTDQTYIIKASNSGVEDVSLTIKTSLEKEQTFIIPGVGERDINILAVAGEYVQFTVPRKGGCIYRVLDSKGVTIATYESLPFPGGNTVVLDFIAFSPHDTEKNFLKHKTGLAKTISDNLVGKTYLLHERYLLENGIKTDMSWVQEACTFSDEYRFRPSRGEFGNFNPERFIFSTVIDEDKSSCSFGAGNVVPTNNISVVTNGKNEMFFPIWDRLAVDGPPSSMIYRELIIDSVSSTGTLSLHREAGANKKEVFIYKPK